MPLEQEPGTFQRVPNSRLPAIMVPDRGRRQPDVSAWLGLAWDHRYVYGLSSEASV